MGRTGKVDLGEQYADKMNRLCKLTGRRGHPSAVRSIIDSVLFDAEQLGVMQIEPQAVGIKSLKGAKRETRK